MDIRGRTILIVGGEPTIAPKLISTLKSAGLRILQETTSNEEVLELCRKRRVDLALIDTCMAAGDQPRQQARAATQAPRKELAALLQRDLKIPVIILANQAEPSAGNRNDFDPYGYLIEPFDHRALWIAMHTALVRRASETACKAAKRELAQSHALFGYAIELSRDGVITVGNDGSILVFNRSAAHMFGYRPTEILGQPFSQLLPEVERERQGDQIAHIFDQEQSSEAARICVMEGRRSDGSLFPIEVSISRVDQNGDVLVTAIVRDISDQRALELRVEHAQKMETVGRLVSAVAHDFNNQLVPVVGYSELLCRSLPSGDPNREDAQEILAAATRASRLTRQLLLLSRQQPNPSQSVCIDEALSSLSGTLVRLAGGERTVEMHLDADGKTVAIDPTSLEQIVLNLVANARDAMPGGGHITLSTCTVSLDGEWGETDPAESISQVLRLRVRDTGVGMNQETMNHIFEPFFTTKPGDTGTGLGLATLQAIVSRAHGTVRVDSALSKGTTVTVDLPLSLEPASTTTITRSSVPVRMTGSDRCAVLVVDDNDSVRGLAGQVLEAAGYDVTLARMPRQAIAICPDVLHVLVADAALPGISGADLADRLVASHGCEVLLSSGSPKEDLQRRGLLPERFAVLPKPYGAESLERAVAEQHRLSHD